MKTKESEERLSVCCGASSTDYPESDLCPECKEHTDFLTEKELEEI